MADGDTTEQPGGWTRVAVEKASGDGDITLVAGLAGKKIIIRIREGLVANTAARLAIKEEDGSDLLIVTPPSAATHTTIRTDENGFSTVTKGKAVQMTRSIAALISGALERKYVD